MSQELAPTFYDKLVKNMFSSLGLAVWTFCLGFTVDVFLIGWHVLPSIFASLVMAFYFSHQTTKNLKGTYFMQNAMAGRASITRRFRRYLRKNELPLDEEEHEEYAKFLQSTKEILQKNPPKRQKGTLVILILIGLISLASLGWQMGAVYLFLILFVVTRIGRSEKALINIEHLQEQLNTRS